MRDELLAPMASPQASERRRPRLGPLRGGDETQGLLGCCGCVGATLVLIWSMCVASLSPNQYGLPKNFVSGSVGTDVVRGGIHFVGPFRSYITFPATQTTLMWSRDSPDHPPIATRTGADPKDPDSGGQPIAITCAVQFEFVPDKLLDVYLSLTSYAGARQRFLLLAGNMVSNTAQEFTPQEFWKDRRNITLRMLHQINETLWAQGVIAVRFEMMRVDFATSFEDSITQVQVAEQQRVVNEYDQQVQQVVQSINVMRADNDALIANISAGAQADAKQLCAGATRDAFHMKQSMKASKYNELQRELGFSAKHMQEYFKIKSVQGQGAHGKVVVGLPQIGVSAVQHGR